MIHINDIKSKKTILYKVLKKLQASSFEQINQNDMQKSNSKPVVEDYGLMLSLVSDSCINSFKLYDIIFQIHENLIKTKCKNTQLEDENALLKDTLKSKDKLLQDLNEQISLLRNKNSRVIQEITLLNRFLKSKANQARDYLTYSNEAIQNENEILKNILSKTVPYNEELMQSLSFYRIQYHLLKKRFANISLAAQQTNIRALEETLSQTQKQLIESEAYQHYSSMTYKGSYGTFIEEIIDCKIDIKNLNEKVSELSSSNSKLKKKIDVSKDVLNNYEKTIEKISYNSSGAQNYSKMHKEDQNVIRKLLNDIDILTEHINSNTDKFDNEKLLNLYQNKERLLEEKRVELAEAHANYAELKEEKNYLEQHLLGNENSYGTAPNDSMLYELFKINQTERRFFKDKLRDAERSLKEVNLRLYIMEEKEQIWRRERDFYIKQHGLLRAETDNSQKFITRMENHINMLNTLLLPHEYLQTHQAQILNSHTNIRESDCSFDDILKDYGVGSISQVSKVTLSSNMNQIKIPHIDHIDFMNCQKRMNDLNKENYILKINSDQLSRDMKIDQQVIQHMAMFVSRIYSKKSLKSYSDVKYDLITFSLTQSLCDGNESDDAIKLRVVRLLDGDHNENEQASNDNLNQANNSRIIANDIISQKSLIENMYSMKTEDSKEIDKIKTQNAILINTNKELLEELDAFKNSHE